MLLQPPKDRQDRLLNVLYLLLACPFGWFASVSDKRRRVYLGACAALPGSILHLGLGARIRFLKYLHLTANDFQRVTAQPILLDRMDKLRLKAVSRGLPSSWGF